MRWLFERYFYWAATRRTLLTPSWPIFHVSISPVPSEERAAPESPGPGLTLRCPRTPAGGRALRWANPRGSTAALAFVTSIPRAAGAQRAVSRKARTGAWPPRPSQEPPRPGSRPGPPILPSLAAVALTRSHWPPTTESNQVTADATGHHPPSRAQSKLTSEEPINTHLRLIQSTPRLIQSTPNLRSTRRGLVSQ